MTKKPDKAFILAAGKGTRLRPYTDTMPKPMVPINGTSIIQRTIEKLSHEGVKTIVINLHHLGDVLKGHLAGVSSPQIIFSEEKELLETGGGIKKALHHFGNDPFFIINGDALWDDDPQNPALSLISSLWDDSVMDILLFLEPKEQMKATRFVGDYTLNDSGHPVRCRDLSGNYMFGGVRIAHPRIFAGTKDGPFSFLSLMDRAEEQGRLHAYIHDRAWYHISTPDDLEEVDALFRRRRTEA